MTIDRDIIRDLMPLCEAGLASESSRRLVESWLRDHPGGRVGASDVQIKPDEGLKALARSRRLRRRLRWLFGSAVGFTVLSLTSELHFAGGQLRSARLLALEMPFAFAPVILAAAGCWLAYFWFKRSLS